MVPENMRPILLVSRFDECFRFYRDTMGFRIAWGKEGDSYASFVVRRSLHLSIFKAEDMAKAIGSEAKPTDAATQDRLALTFEVGDLPKTIKQLQRRGAQFATSVIDRKDWGIRTVFLRDPDGNLLQLESELPKDQWTEDLQAESKVYRPET